MSQIQITDLASGYIELEEQMPHIYGGRFQFPSRILPADGNEFVSRPRPVFQPAPAPYPAPAPAPYHPPVSSPPPGFTVPIPGGFAAGGTNPFGSPDVY